MRFTILFQQEGADEPMRVLQSPYPIPVPRDGELVVLPSGPGDPLTTYVVSSVEWSFVPLAGAEDPLAPEGPTMELQTRVWLDRP